MAHATYQDLIRHVLDYTGAEVSKAGERLARRAVQAAYRDVAAARAWSYYQVRGRIATVAQQTTGTVAYDHTGGAHERLLTLTSATWPDWAGYGTVVIANVAYDVEERKSSTTLTLAEATNPGADVASGTSYTLYRDNYALPADFAEIGEVVLTDNDWPVSYVTPQEWLQLQRVRQGPGTPRHFTIQGEASYQGALAIRFFPPPDTARQVDFLYKKRPRDLALEEYSTGTVTVSNGSAAVTGSGTAWDSSMEGAVIRFSSGSTSVPTGRGGDHPYRLERRVLDVTGATALTLDSAVTEAFSGVKYSISDPADIEEGAMLNYLLRECEHQARVVRRMEPTRTELASHRQAQVLAFEADSRSFAKRAAGGRHLYRPRLRDMPVDLSS